MFESQLDLDAQLMVHTGIGRITADDFLNATKRWFGNEYFDPQSPVVWDIDQAFLDMSLEDMRQMYLRIRNNVQAKRTGGKTAWVHSSGTVRSLIHIVRDEFDWGSEWRTFQSFEDARDWCLRPGD